jgi:5'-phosphate synthase pdxT subunit
VSAPPLVGVLALQGGFAAHAQMLRELGADVREVRTVADISGPPTLDGLVLPGGESTTMTLGIEREGLAGPLAEVVRAGTPVLGTCAGLIMLDREHLGLMDITARRNAFGRQLHSFEEDLRFPDLDEPVRAVFIRAPWIEDPGEDVEVLAAVDGHPVAARQGDVVVVAFHPELSGERRLHEQFLGRVRARAAAQGRNASSTSPT